MKVIQSKFTDVITDGWGCDTATPLASYALASYAPEKVLWLLKIAFNFVQ